MTPLRILALAGLCAIGTLQSAQAQAPACDETLGTSAALTEVLLRPAQAKAGHVICLRPGTYAPLNWRVLRGAFDGLPADRPLTVTSADPARPAVLTGPWEMASGTRGAPNGNLILDRLIFRLTSPEVPAGTKGYERHLFAVRLGVGGVTENFTLSRSRIEGPMREARKGGQRTRERISAIWGHGRNISIKGNHFSQIVDGVSVFGSDITIAFNRGERLWGDMIRLSAVPLPDRQCQPSKSITVRNNIVSDVWSDNAEHPDIIHMFPISGIACGLEDVLIEGNIAYLGREGMVQPGRPTGFGFGAPEPVAARLTPPFDTLRVLVAPGTTTLPRADCRAGPQRIGIQRAAGEGRGPLTLVPAPGDRLEYYGEVRGSKTLHSPGEAWLFFCRRGETNLWHMRGMKPGPQGFFSNQIKGPAGYRNITIRHNVFWLTQGHGVRLTDTDNRSITVVNNSFLQPFHGDANGDGVPNTNADGFNADQRGSRMLIEGRDVTVARNISAWLGREQVKRPGWAENDDGLSHTDGGRSMIARFNWPRGSQTFFPTTPREAIEMARPRADGLLAGKRLGAVAPRADLDWYDWSWVPAR